MGRLQHRRGCCCCRTWGPWAAGWGASLPRFWFLAKSAQKVARAACSGLCAQEEGISSPSGKCPQVASSGGSPAPLEDTLPIPSTASSGTSTLLSPVGNLFLWRFCWLLPLYQQAGSAFHLEAIFIFKKICLKQDSCFKEEKVKMLMILNQTLCICHLHPINGL